MRRGLPLRGTELPPPPDRTPPLRREFGDFDRLSEDDMELLCRRMPGREARTGVFWELSEQDDMELWSCVAELWFIDDDEAEL
jgi:hypothetical protein